jgi:hypothetical protein
MAIAGTGGCVPSCRVIDRSGTLVATGHVTNTPPELIYSDEERRARGRLVDALPKLWRGESILVDMTNGQFLKLIGLWNDLCTNAAVEEDGRDAGIAALAGSATTANG